MACKYTSCTICLDDFTKPKFLPCHHTFCQKCIDDYIRVHAHSNTFNCPICRRQTTVPKDGASQFVSNFYLEDDEDDTLYCTRHKKNKIEVYCRDCRESCCLFCAMMLHQNHTKADFDYVDRDIREKFSKLKTESKKKIKQLQEHSRFLKTRISDLENSCKAACDNVDKQIDTICKKVRKMGGTIKDDINKIGEDENSKLTKLVEDVDKMTLELKKWCEYSDRILQHRPIITAVDKDELVDIQTKTDYNIFAHLTKPDVIYPYYPMMEVDEDSLKKLLGEMQITFTSSFSMNDILHNDRGYYSVGVIIQGLVWCVSVGIDSYGNHEYPLFTNLGMNTVEDKTISGVKARYTVKVLNINDENKSLVKHGTQTFIPGCCIGAAGINAKEIGDFTDNNHVFTIHVAVYITDVYKYIYTKQQKQRQFVMLY
ncbi:E3 ubiquitin-protein ligase TRIM63-like [Patella vulgata]|uniref:E3 ubiquitin-protein ligase TRIM63-like n=1 Tax=Patella vulgata TaxID=6465 RepID=UPI002180564E|nr:E3 ubiquitin-protein ligase TRIM63-like [Patella vulgata]